MSDYFKELEGRLHRAAQRRARRRRAARPAAALAVAAVAAAAVVAVAGPPEPEREVAVPRAATDACGEDPPREIVDRFEVFERAPDESPPEFEELFRKKLFGPGRPLKLWPPQRTNEAPEVWLYPAQMGASCLRADPAVCTIVIDGDQRIPGCHRLPAGSTTAYELHSGPDSRTFLVEDGVEVSLEGARESEVDNVATFTGKGAGGARLTITGRLLRDGCERELVNSGGPIDERIAALAAAFRAASTAPTDPWNGALLDSGLSSIRAPGRIFVQRPDWSAGAVPAVFCRAEEPGVCVVVFPKFPTEMGSYCANIAQIRAGEAVATFGLDDQRLIVAAFVPDGTSAATLEGRPMTVDGNLAWIELEGRFEGERRVALDGEATAPAVPDGGVGEGHGEP